MFSPYITSERVSYGFPVIDKALELGFKIAFGGSVTFLNAKENKRVVQGLDLQHLLIETDAPYLTPHPFRGKINEPKYIELVVKEIAKIKNESVEKIANITYKNACDLFGIEE